MLPDGIALLRPLLGFSRAQLREHCLANDVAWLEDASNTDPRHRRNYLRHVVLPTLEAERPGIAADLAEMGERHREVAAGLEQVVDEIWPLVWDGNGLELDRILTLDQQPRWQVWRRLARHLGFPHERQHLKRIDDLANGVPGRRLHLGRWLLLRRVQRLSWELAHPMRHGEPVTIAGPGDYSSTSERITCHLLPRPQTIAFAPEEAWIDAACCTMPLVWRAAEPEERFVPLGAPGRQTVVKYLASRGVASRLRAGAAVVADAQGIVWVPGFTIAERVKITECTRDVVHLHRTPTCGTAATPSLPLPQGKIDEL
jgi:tRNA(Ile)-lysidine synthase